MEQRTTARFHPYGGRRNRRHHNNNHEQQPELQGFSGIISNILKKSLSWLFPEQLPERDYSDGDEEASDAEFTIMDFTSSDHTSRTTSSLDTPSSRTPLHRDSVSGSSRDDLGKDTHQQEDQDMNEFQEERSYQLRNYLQHEMTRLKQVSQHSHSYSNKSQKVGRKHHLQNGIPGLTQPDNRLEQTSSDITPPKAVKAHFHSQHQETRPTESAHENLAQTVFVQEEQEKAPDMLAFETDKRRRSSTQSMSTSDDDKPKKKLRSIPGRFSALDSDEEEEDLKRLEREKEQRTRRTINSLTPPQREIQWDASSQHLQRRTLPDTRLDEIIKWTSSEDTSVKKVLDTWLCRPCDIRVSITTSTCPLCHTSRSGEACGDTSSSDASRTSEHNSKTCSCTHCTCCHGAKPSDSKDKEPALASTPSSTSIPPPFAFSSTTTTTNSTTAQPPKEASTPNWASSGFKAPDSSNKWKCPTCDVMNEDKLTKCPCCETAKPNAGSSQEKKAAPLFSSTPSLFGVTPSSSTPSLFGITAPTTSTPASLPSTQKEMPTVTSNWAASGFKAPDAADKWKCPTCAVMNDDNLNKCPCCEATKPGSSGASNGTPAIPSLFAPKTTTTTTTITTTTATPPLFSLSSGKDKEKEPLNTSNWASSGFKAHDATGKWKCPTCDVMNEDKLAKCPCCETAKPGASASNKTITVPPMFNFSGPASTSSITQPSTQKEMPTVTSNWAASGFKAPDAAGKWKCPTCAVMNDDNLNKCPCCEATKPGSSGASSGAPAIPSLFAPKTTTATTTVPSAPVLANPFAFGAKTPSSSSTTTALTTATPTFSFGPTSTAPASTSASTLSFGAPMSKPASTSAPPLFSFAPSSAPSSGPSTSTAPFAFGPAPSASTATTPSPFAFGASTSTSTGAAPTLTSGVPTFSLGSSTSTTTTTAAPSSAPAFSFGASTPASVAPAVTKAPTLSFGAPSTTAPSAPAFAFGGATSTPAPASTASPFTFGSSTPTAPTATSTASPFAFGASTAPATSTTATTASTAPPLFSFGASSTTATNSLAVESTPSASESMMSPAMSPAKPVTSTSTFTGFGASTPASGFGAFGSSTPASTGFSGFGSTTGATSQPTFSFGSSTSAPPPATASAPATFGQPGGTGGFSAPASQGFGASTGFGESMQTTPSSTGFGAQNTTSSFGGFNSTPTPGFGNMGTTQSTGFGAQGITPAFGSAVVQPQTGGFGAQGSAPSFGFSGQTPGSSFGAQGASGFGMGQTQGTGFGVPGAPGASFGFGAAANQPAQGGGFAFNIGAAPAETEKKAPQNRKIAAMRKKKQR